MNQAEFAAFLRDVRRQIHVAEDAGAEHDDLCIVVPISYATMVTGFPSIELDGRTVALVTKLWARDFCDVAIAECDPAGLPPLSLTAPSNHVGLWSESPSFGPPKLDDFKPDVGRLF